MDEVHKRTRIRRRRRLVVEEEEEVVIPNHEKQSYEFPQAPLLRKRLIDSYWQVACAIVAAIIAGLIVWYLTSSSEDVALTNPAHIELTSPAAKVADRNRLDKF